jgi:hypothetical protein
MRLTFVATRLLVAVAVLAAILAQLQSSIDFAPGSESTAVVVNFFSYFTVDSNSITVLALVFGCALLRRRVSVEPQWFTIARASVTTYMVITGIVYNLLLRGEAQSGAVIPWSNEILHVVAPVYVLVDWLFAPGRNRVGPRDVLYVVAFPIGWAAYTLLRGPFASDPFTRADHWYPYPFLNPVTSAHGYLTVTCYVVGIAVAVIGVASALAWDSRRRSPALG